MEHPVEFNIDKEQNAIVANVVINIHGGHNQILPNATKAEQHFFIGNRESEESGEATIEEVRQGVGGNLRIYYPQERELAAITQRITDCGNATDLAKLVVHDMLPNTFLDESRIVSEGFIGALKQYISFTKGATVGNIRVQINKVRRG